MVFIFILLFLPLDLWIKSFLTMLSSSGFFFVFVFLLIFSVNVSLYMLDKPAFKSVSGTNCISLVSLFFFYDFCCYLLLLLLLTLQHSPNNQAIYEKKWKENEEHSHRTVSAYIRVYTVDIQMANSIFIFENVLVSLSRLIMIIFFCLRFDR